MAARNRSSSYASSERYAPVAEPWTRSSPGVDSTTPSASQPTPSSTRSVKKRHSFFARSNSDASGKESVGKRSQNHPNHPSVAEMEESTAATASAAQPRRRKTEPLETIRNSIFGGRRKPSVSSSKENPSVAHTRAPSRNAFFSVAPPSNVEQYHTEEQFYHSLRKRTISPPYNFEHLTHTNRTHLSALETVDEKDLQREFWSVSMDQKPRKHLSGIAAHDLRKQLRSDLASRRHSRSRITPAAVLGEHTEDAWKVDSVQDQEKVNEVVVEEVALTQVDDEQLPRAMHSHQTTSSHPKRRSSLNAMRPRGEPPPPDPSTFYESGDSSDTEGKNVPSIDLVSSNDHVVTAPLVPSNWAALEPADLAYRAKQPLPEAPRQSAVLVAEQRPRSTEKYNTNTITPSSTRSSTSGVPIRPSSAVDAAKSSPKSRESSRFIEYPPSFTGPDEARRPSIRSDQSWEDDVDFCYQQNAMSTCNFDWETVSPAQLSSASSEVDPTYHPVCQNARPASATKSHESTDGHAEEQYGMFPGEANTRKPALHSRGSSVGHRGFLAARRSSQDLLGKYNPAPTTLRFSQGAAQSTALSPIFSEAAVSETTVEKPTAKPTFVEHTFQFPSINGGVRVEYLSDPESCRNSGSSKHRKSSSYGSYDSKTSKSTSSRETGTRWSISSMSSVPDLLHSRPKSKSSLSKSVISRPLESLPQSPTANAAAEEEEEDSAIVPRAARTTPVRNTFIMRRPQSPEDRAILQNAGRAVQRGRPALPTRFSPVMETPFRGIEASMEDGGWL